MTEHAAADDGDFLDSGLHAGTAPAGDGETAGSPPYGTPSDGARGRTDWKAAARPVAWLAAGVVVGAVVVAAWHSGQTNTVPTNPTAAQGQFPGGPGGPGGQGGPGGPGGPSGQLPNGQGPGGMPGDGGGPGFDGGPGFGGRAGEQHVSGTVTAVGSSTVTVKLADGSTATYSVVASSDIVKNGARVALSAIKVGDTVFLHVYPSNGKTVVEHLFAGPARRV